MSEEIIRSGYSQVVDENTTTISNQIVNTTSSENIIEIDTDDEKIISFDDNIVENDSKKDDEENIIPKKIDKDQLIDDGYLGIPIFSDKELSIIENNLMMDISIIDNNKFIMSSSLETINSFKDVLSPTEEQNKMIKDADNTYLSARNLLIQYKESVSEYFKFIDENKYEILGNLKEESDKLINKYIESTTKEFNLIYTNDSLMFYMIAVAIKRTIKNIENDSIYKIITLKQINDFDIEFEKEIYEILKPISFLTSNISNAYELNKMSTVERDVIKLITSIITRFRKISSFTEEQNEKCNTIIGTPRNIFVSFLFKLSTLIGKKTFFDFRNEKRKHTLKLKNINKKAKTPIVYYPFHDNFIKTRLSLHIVDFYIKKLFSFSLFGDQKVLDKKESFLSLVNEMNNKFKSAELIQSLINTFSFKLIFNELVNIFKFIDDKNYTNNLRRANMLKSYLMFVAYHKNSTIYKNYNFKELYTEYFNVLLNKIEKYVNK